MTKENKSPADELAIEYESCCSDSSCCAPQSPIVRAMPKVGRNDPCPCGSERKFKKCCGQYL